MIAEMKQTEKQKNTLVREVTFFAVGGILGTALLLVSLWWITRDSILPGVKIAGFSVGGMTATEATTFFQTKTKTYSLPVTYGGGTWTVPPDSYRLSLPQAIQKARDVGKKWDTQVFTGLLAGSVTIPLGVTLDPEKYASFAAEINDAAEVVAQPAKLSFDGKKINFVNGDDGVMLDSDKLQEMVVNHLAHLNNQPISAPSTVQSSKLTPLQSEAAIKMATSLIGRELAVEVDGQKVTLSTQENVSFVSLDPQTAGSVDLKTITAYVRGLSERFNSDPQDAKFEFRDGKVQEFAPGKNGIAINEDETARLIADALGRLSRDSKTESVTASLTLKPPEVETSEVNNLGITERIGRGDSYYAHSIANRVFNVGLAASRVNGALVAPGDEFSFDQFVGEISGATGYKTAYVISGGRTVLGDGGGVCQVSTTLFRAVMDAGMPITERWAHAYRVGYYEQNSDPGIDATVYAPSKDFKFVNDTPHYILIQAINDPVNLHLIFEIYGTKDGRVATVTKPKVWGITPPPPPLYQDDPSLPAGTVKQVDFAAWGAKTSFEYTVVRDGQTIFEKTYNSTYQPWQSVFMRGTGGAVTP